MAIIVKGAGSSPVILAPKELPIEWSRYEAVEVQMLSEGGTEVKVKIGNGEYRDKLPLQTGQTPYNAVRWIPSPPHGRHVPSAIALADPLVLTRCKLAPQARILGSAHLHDHHRQHTLVRVDGRHRLCTSTTSTLVPHCLLELRPADGALADKPRDWLAQKT